MLEKFAVKIYIYIYIYCYFVLEHNKVEMGNCFVMDPVIWSVLQKEGRDLRFGIVV